MGKITVETCEIEGLKVITPAVFGDARGYFMETYNYNDYKEAGIDQIFVQDNQSAAKKGVLRGLHSAENKKQFFIPKNFAHGFLVLSDYAEFAYKCTDFYHPNDEGGIRYDDPDIGVKWPIPEGMELIMSEKDTKWDGLKEYNEFRRSL